MLPYRRIRSPSSIVCNWPMVRIPSASSVAANALPTPQMVVTGRGARKRDGFSRPMTEKPRGFCRSEATFARICNRRARRRRLCRSPSRCAARISPAFAPADRDAAARCRRVPERLVDRKRLNERRQFLHRRADLAPDLDVFLHVGADDHRLRAGLQGLEHRHGRPDAMNAGNIAGGRDHPRACRRR